MKKVLELRLANAIRIGDMDGVLFATDKDYEILQDGEEFLLKSNKPYKDQKVCRVGKPNAQYWVLADDQLGSVQDSFRVKVQKAKERERTA